MRLIELLDKLDGKCGVYDLQGKKIPRSSFTKEMLHSEVISFTPTDFKRMEVVIKLYFMGR